MRSHLRENNYFSSIKKSQGMFCTNVDTHSSKMVNEKKETSGIDITDNHEQTLHRFFTLINPFFKDIVSLPVTIQQGSSLS